MDPPNNGKEAVQGLSTSVNPVLVVIPFDSGKMTVKIGFTGVEGPLNHILTVVRGGMPPKKNIAQQIHVKN